jgi:tetratricopeptide (TPR) repeat protein
MTPKSEKTFIKDMDENPLFINAMLAAIDCQNSTCSKAEDREQIHLAIQNSIGFSGLNYRIFEVMRNWIIQRNEKELLKRKELLGETDASVIIALNSLGRLYQHQGSYEKARIVFLECYEKAKFIHGVTHDMTFRAVNSLAGFYSTIGEHEQALVLVEECLKLQSQQMSEDDPRRIIALSNLAMTHQSLGQYDQEEYYFTL